MGVYQSSFEKTDAQAKIIFNPSKADGSIRKLFIKIRFFLR